MSATEHEGITGITFDSDGHRLVGVLYLARGDGPKPTALLLHGCPGLEKNLDLAVVLRDRGWNSLVFHYRGCWGSAGRYDLRTIPSDVAAAVGCLACHPLVDPDRIAAVGHSMGGWAAIVAAGDDPRLRAVAVYGAPAQFGGVLALGPDRIEGEFTRFVAATPSELAAQFEEVAASMNPLKAVTAIAPRPLLIVHGTQDMWVPVWQARELMAHAGPDCRYVEVVGADHAFSWHRAPLRELIADWLEKIWEDPGSWEDPVHSSTPNPPASPNPPRKSALYGTGFCLMWRMRLLGSVGQSCRRDDLRTTSHHAAKGAEG